MAAPPDTTATAQAESCPSCAQGRLVPDEVKTAFWAGERLVVVEGIPALVCESCGERYYEDRTVMELDLMRGGGFPGQEAERTIPVPVFTFRPGVPAGEEKESDNGQE